jgi:hypothetical protein
VIIFPLYALVVWWVTWWLPARWMRVAFVVGAVAIELVVSKLLILHVPRPDLEPDPIWLMGPAWGYGLLLLGVGLLIAFVKPRPDHLCHACGYDLSGNELGVCPECGAVARCRACKEPLVHDDFGPCPACREPFPRFAPFSNAKEEEARAPRDTGKLIEKYVEHTRETA